MINLFSCTVGFHSGGISVAHACPIGTMAATVSAARICFIKIFFFIRILPFCPDSDAPQADIGGMADFCLK